MKKLAIPLFIAFLSVGSYAHSWASNLSLYKGQDCQDYCGPKRQGDKIVINYFDPVEIEQITLSMTGHRRSNLVQVIAHMIKGSKIEEVQVARIDVPGRDPEYPVYFPSQGEVVKLLVLFNDPVDLEGFQINYRDDDQMGFNPEGEKAQPAMPSVGNLTSPSEIAKSASIEASKILNAFSQVVTDQERKDIKRIQTASLNLEVKASGRSEFSSHTDDEAVKLMNAIKNAKPFLQKMEDATWHNSVLNLLTIAERIDYLLEPKNQGRR